MNGITKLSSYDIPYGIKLLGGKEFEVRKKNCFNINSKIVARPGTPYVSIDEGESRKYGRPITDNKDAYTRRAEYYFRIDLSINYKVNNEKVTHHFKLDMQNILNAKGRYMAYYDMLFKKEEFYLYQGFTPYFDYVLNF